MKRYFVLAWVLLAAAVPSTILADDLTPITLVIVSQLVLWYAFGRWQSGR